MPKQQSQQPNNNELLKSFPVIYNTGEVVYVKRVPRALFSDLMKLQQEILADFMEANAAIGLMIQSEKTWNNMAKVASMLPLVGTDDKLQLSKIEDDLEQICRIFCTESMTDSGELDAFKPSLISKLHHFDYAGDLGKILTQIQKRKQEEISELETMTQTS